MSLKRASDAIYAFRFLRLLTKDWTSMKAYELGLIDEKGKKLKKARTPEEKNQYTLFHRLIYNLKRLLNFLPGSLSRKFGSYASAIYLIKEATGLDDNVILRVLREAGYEFNLDENTEETNLCQDIDYSINKPIPLQRTDIFALPGHRVRIIREGPNFLNTQLYEGYHLLSGEKIIISAADVNFEPLNELTSASVSTGDVAMPPAPKTTDSGEKFFDFDVPSSVFRRFKGPRKKKYQLEQFLDMNDNNQRQIAEFARKHRDAKVILRDETTGALQSVRDMTSG